MDITLASHIRSLQGPILVTGASGFIGANLFEKIAESRDDVFAVVMRERGWRLTEVADDKIIAVDINDPLATRNLVESISPKTIFHCVAYGAYSFEDRAPLIYQTNAQSLVNLVEILAPRNIAAFIHAGSSSEYGSNCTAPRENDHCLPNSPYAVSKVAASEYLRYMGKSRNFPCINLRLYSVYGPLEDTSRLIPNLLREASNGHLPPFVDARTSRDFVHVDDVCSAFILAASSMRPDLYGEDINIGSGEKTTILDLAEITRHIFNIEENARFGTMPGRAWDLSEWYSNPTKAKTTIGWAANIPLPEGLRLTMQWVRSLPQVEFTKLTKKGFDKKKRSVTAIIACYKDAPAIPIMHRRLTDTFKKIGVDYELLFVNDGSPDDSEAIIKELSRSDPRVIGISHSRNFGSQMAFRSGMELATKDAVVLLDGDLQDPPELIEAFHERWESGFDVVYGRRIKREMPWYWSAAYRIFYRVFAFFSYVKIPLDAGDFSLMDRRVVEWLLRCPERDLFVRGLRAYAGFRQTGVDYIRPERMFGKSTNNLMKNIEWAKKGIFSFSNVPLTMLTTTGVLLFAFSTIAALTVAALRIFIPDVAPRGITTLLVVTLMFGSFNLFAIGLVGEYVAKIMTEVKRRPRMIRSALIRSGEVTELLPDGKSR